MKQSAKALDKNTVYILLYRRLNRMYIVKMMYRRYLTGFNGWDISGRSPCYRRKTLMYCIYQDRLWYAREYQRTIKVLKYHEAIAAREQANKEISDAQANGSR